MKIVVFGDVHGNLPALEKFLLIEKNNYDLIVCHGDVVNYAPWSNECVQLLDNLENAILLKGNHEDNYLKKEYSGSNEVAKTFFKACFANFNEFLKIEKYKEKCQVGNFIVRHTLSDKYIYPDTNLGHFNIENNYIIGHSHYAFDRTINNYNIVNTGSLGQNRVYINVSDYVVYDTDKNKVELKSFKNDIDLVINEMYARKYPDFCLEYYKNKKRQ
jgi:predicted phosphodiesterase